VTPANIDIVFAGPPGKYLNKPGLLDGEQEQLRISDQRKIQGESRKHRAGVAARRTLRTRECVVQTTMVQDPNPLADNAVGSRLWIGARHRLQHHRADTGQSEFAGHHQPIRTSAGDDDVNHLAELSSSERSRQPADYVATRDHRWRPAP
jgi:hypothetical protein